MVYRRYQESSKIKELARSRDVRETFASIDKTWMRFGIILNQGKRNNFRLRPINLKFL